MLLDMKEGRTLRPFVSSILRDAKALELPLRNQLEYAFEALDWRIQAQLKKPTAETTLEKFMEQLDNRESILQRTAENHHFMRPSLAWPAT